MPSSRRAIDWSQLPPELLSKITGTLDEIADRVRFSSVCRSWRSTPKSTPRVRLPWLLLEDPARLCWLKMLMDQDAPRRYLSLSDNKIYTIPLPGDRSSMYYGSAHGWLLTLDHARSKKTFSLFNPLTKARIFLSPLTADVNRFRHCKLIVTPETHVVMVATGCGGKLLYCYRQPSSEGMAGGSWTKIRVADPNGAVPGIGSFTYFRGHYFVVGEKEMGTMVINAGTNQVTSVIPSVLTDHPYHRSNKRHKRYLAETSSGDKLFLIVSPSRSRILMFEVFELNQTGKQAEWSWSKVRSIGPNVLFVDDVHAMVLPANDLCGGNCIIFFDDDCESSQVRPDVKNLGRFHLFSIGNDKVKRLPLSWHQNVKGCSSQGWFLPTL